MEGNQMKCTIEMNSINLFQKKGFKNKNILEVACKRQKLYKKNNKEGGAKHVKKRAVK